MRNRCVLVLSSLMAAMLVPPAQSAEKQAWPATVRAHYSLRYQGIEVGDLKITSETSATSYTLSGSSAISVLFGTLKVSGNSTVSGVIERGAPAPTAFAFDWKQNKKAGAVRMGYKGGAASDIAVEPPAKIKPDTVPLAPSHKAGALDPMSAILAMTKSDGRPPCERRVPVFDGKHRYDIVLAPKRQVKLASAAGGGGAETGFVCRIMYEPIAGHRDNEDTKAYAANKDAEIVLRRIPGSDMVIPYSVTIPTSWGTGTMVTKKIEIVTDKAAAKIALTN